MDLAVFYEVVVPIYEMATAILIMISTPVDSFNFFSDLLQLKDPKTGISLFNVVNVTLVCSRCEHKAHPEHCRHKMKYLPPWKSRDKMALIQLIMGDRVTTLLRETRGMVTDTGGGLVEKEHLEALRRRLLWVGDRQAQLETVLVICDPNGVNSPTSSEMALIALCRPAGMSLPSYAVTTFKISLVRSFTR